MSQKIFKTKCSKCKSLISHENIFAGISAAKESDLCDVCKNVDNPQEDDNKKDGEK